MSLIGRYIDQILPVGSITVVQHDGTRETYGPGGGKHVTVKLHDRRAAIDIFRNPRLNFGELYMDGRLTIEDGTMLELLQLVVGAKPWEQGKRKALGKGKAGRLASLFRRNNPRKSRRNVAHHYDIGNELYALFLDDDLQYSCAYFTDPANSLEQAQADKKAHIAAKLDLRPGQRVLDVGCGW
ncbi:MAG TPA: class I SAM-dependent methyltransferase, partial [Sphingomicrobium sp.]